MMSRKRDYTSSSLVITIVVVVLLLGVSLIPSFNIGTLKFKKVNIISDIISAQEGETPLTGDAYFDTTFLAEADALRVDSISDSAAYLGIPATKSERWVLYGETNLDSLQHHTMGISGIDTSHVVLIEDYGGSIGEMSRFYNRLINKHPSEQIRIAVLGDSFIEGDIITADIREQLQTMYGGSGVGFVPFDYPYAKFRGTISLSSKGWQTLNITNYQKLADSVKNKFFISGYVSIPTEGATTSMRGVGFRKHLKTNSFTKLIFTNRKNSTIRVTINDTLNKTFTPDPSPYPQELNIAVGPMHSISATINNVDGFVGYGMILQDSVGVSLDNYSIRGNSGMALHSTNSTINSQISRMVGYDLIILQYGLNVMSSSVSNYDSYSKKLEGIIEYIQKCFPKSSILVMGVGDRSTQIDGEFATMPSVGNMIAAQRKAARNKGIAFWNTYEAMGGYNSMVRFVENRWAAKDYTHISYPGGQYIAKQFVKAIAREVIKHDKPKIKEITVQAATHPPL